MSDDVVSGGLTRRAVVRGLAWSVPVVAVAVSAPLAAASTVCSINNPLGNGLATVTAISYPQISPAPYGSGVMYTLGVNTIYTWRYEVRLRQPSIAGSYGDFGLKGGDWQEIDVVEATCSDSRIETVAAPTADLTQYARATALMDLPEGTVFTVTINVRLTAPTRGDLLWCMNAWWAGAYRNNNCADPSMPAYAANQDLGNTWDTGPGSQSDFGDPLVTYQVI